MHGNVHKREISFLFHRTRPLKTAPNQIVKILRWFFYVDKNKCLIFHLLNAEFTEGSSPETHRPNRKTLRNSQIASLSPTFPIAGPTFSFLSAGNEHLDSKNLYKSYGNLSRKIMLIPSWRQRRGWDHGIILRKRSDCAAISSWVAFAHVKLFQTCLKQATWMDRRRNVKLTPWQRASLHRVSPLPPAAMGVMRAWVENKGPNQSVLPQKVNFEAF